MDTDQIGESLFGKVAQFYRLAFRFLGAHTPFDAIIVYVV